MATENAPPVAEAELVDETESVMTIALPQALEAMERAQQDVMIQRADEKPRPAPDLIRKEIIAYATITEEVAESCYYTLKRKDKTGTEKVIEGPSVRLAQIAVGCYRNLRAASRVIANDGKKITAQGFCFDVERNIAVQTEVSRRIVGRNGRVYSEDMQIVTGMAACAIAKRNAIFEVVPRALIDSAYAEIKKRAVGTQTTLPLKREKILKRFNGMGVSNDQILATAGKQTVEEIDLEALEFLIGLGVAIKDNMITIAEAFAFGPEETSEETSGRRESLVEKLRAMQESKKK